LKLLGRNIKIFFEKYIGKWSILKIEMVPENVCWSLQDER
jgi:hypothetical protein